jgi:16S rRNA processing protein RimM
MTARPDPAELVLLGTVGAPRGIKGDIRIKSFTEAPEDIAAYGPLWNADATRSFSVRVIGEAKGQILARIDGVGDRTAAEALKGTALYVPRSALPAPDDDSYYLVDLIGLRVETAAGEAWGEVRAVHDFGAGDVLELAGGPHAGLMIPFTRDTVPEVDLTGGRLVIDPPDGLLEPPEGGASQDKE